MLACPHWARETWRTTASTCSYMPRRALLNGVPDVRVARVSTRSTSMLKNAATELDFDAADARRRMLGARGSTTCNGPTLVGDHPIGTSDAYARACLDHVAIGAESPIRRRRARRRCSAPANGHGTQALPGPGTMYVKCRASAGHEPPGSSRPAPAVIVDVCKYTARSSNAWASCADDSQSSCRGGLERRTRRDRLAFAHRRTSRDDGRTTAFTRDRVRARFHPVATRRENALSDPLCSRCGAATLRALRPRAASG